MKTAIVDDDPIVCTSLTTILETTEAADVLWTANNGETAVAKYFNEPANRPDVLLIDIQMPGVNGLKAAESIIGRDKNARILFLTTFDDKKYIDQALALGAKGYLIKQDVASVGPALHAVMAGQAVLGTQVLNRLSKSDESNPCPIDPTNQSSGPTSTTSSLRLPTLTERERDIARLVAKGLDNHDIAAELYLSEGTIRNRITDILNKSGFTNRTQLAVAWIYSGER